MNDTLRAVAQAIADAAGERHGASAASAAPVDGGSISTAWRLRGEACDYFVKINTAGFADSFAGEAEGLRALAGAVSPVPTFIATGTAGGHSFLALEFLELSPLDRGAGIHLGRQLATLHRQSADDFGWHRDNTLGATPQDNTRHVSWPHFFTQRRLLPQLQRAQGNGLDPATCSQGLAVAERLGGLFTGYRPVPSLLHGDLWSGNAARTSDGCATMFDPACYFGDREADLAMSELFGGFPESFYAAYREAWPLDSGYETRKTLYNLYHVLNHFNLFGDAYRGQAQRMIGRLLAELKR